MKAKLLLVAENINFDELGRISANNLYLDVMQTSFPCTLPSLDVLTAWTRLPDEPEKSNLWMIVETNGKASERVNIPIDFRGQNEVIQPFSLDEFELQEEGVYVFHFGEGETELANWIMRAHLATANTEIGEAK